MRAKTAVLPIYGLLIADVCFGQLPPAQLKFEVASVKPSAPEAQGMFIRYLPGGGLRITGATLRNLIAIAYGVRGFQISGGPKWIAADCFDIDARLTTDASASSVSTAEDQHHASEALRGLLASRFQLTLHLETTDQPEFALVIAKGGPKLQESSESSSFIRRMGRGWIKAESAPLRLFVLNISNELDRMVIDETGLTGKYSFEFKWNSNPLSTQPSEAPDLDGTSIFTALQEQLGLRLESRKGPVRILAIESAARPSGN